MSCHKIIIKGQCLKFLKEIEVELLDELLATTIIWRIPRDIFPQIKYIAQIEREDPIAHLRVEAYMSANIFVFVPD